jgi:RNA polymerase sigma factor (sigma-70 family)
MGATRAQLGRISGAAPVQINDCARFITVQRRRISMEEQQLIPHLFRTEFSRITSVVAKLFGFEHIGMSEDIASETFLSALQTWPYKGIPENPTAWLYTVAKNKAKNVLHRKDVFEKKIVPVLEINQAEEVHIDLTSGNILDSQLQMMFTVCNPILSKEAQIGLALRLLCGFGIEEIANAFLTKKETINKRLTRAKEKLREHNVKIEWPGEEEIHNRLNAVLRTLYLLFNEGYYSESSDDVLREDLCWEAMRLTQLLLDNEHTNKPAVNALMALMCFHASRFEARKNSKGELVLYDQQDETLWSQPLIAKGAYYLNQASTGDILSKYHLEAAIGYWHTQKEDTQEKWSSILQLYDQLLQLEYSPVAALNRIFALSKVKGKKIAIEEAKQLQLKNHYYYWLMGELYTDNDFEKAKENFQAAYKLAKTETERSTIEKKLNSLMAAMN